MDTPQGAILDHIGLAVRDLAAAVRTYERLFPNTLRSSPVYDGPVQGVRLCFLSGAGPTLLELVQPLGATGPVARFLERRGEGLHHICFGVASIEAELERLAAAGTTLVDRTPRPGHHGKVAFLHPRAAHGVLIELLERHTVSPPPAPAAPGDEGAGA